ncbi:uncharacterized protein LOC119963236 [Scyliorhinus canicula]|uniref:uncharacterized protein LOC119963236 n=1 Tax=Scyliorhinus canicula TaxID=7830 RepID=UPI0018F7AE85|nr:uncharacterized protein LOC119963236 [Scyliorhinus canicula]
MIVTTWILYCWANGKIHGPVCSVSIGKTDEVKTVRIEELIPDGDQAQCVNGQNTSVAVVSVQETEVGTKQSDSEDEEELNLQALVSENKGQLLWRRAILVTSVQNDQQDLGVSLEISEGVKDCQMIEWTSSSPEPMIESLTPAIRLDDIDCQIVSDCQMIEWTSSSPEPMIESLTPAVHLDDIDCQIEQENSVNGNSDAEDRSAGEVSSVAIDDYPEDQASLLSNTEAATVDNTPAGAFTNFPDDDEMDSSDLESSSDTWSFKSTGFLFVRFPSSSENDSLLSNTERAITDNTTATGMDVNIDLESPLDSDTCNSTGQLHRQFPSNTERAITDNTTATGMDDNINLESPLDSDTCNSTGQLHRQLLSNTERAIMDNTTATGMDDNIDLELPLDSETCNSTGHLHRQLLSNTEGAIMDNTTAGACANVPDDEEMESIDIESSSDSGSFNSIRVSCLPYLTMGDTEYKPDLSAKKTSLKHSVEKVQSWLADKSVQVKKGLEKSRVASDTRNIVERSAVRIRSWKAEVEEKIRRRLGRGPSN